MTGRLKQYPLSLQLITFVGLFIAFILLYLTFLNTVFPAISGYTLIELQNGNSADTKVVGYLKLTQFLYTFVVYLVPAVLFAWLMDKRPFTWLQLDHTPHLLPAALAILVMLSALPLVAFSSEWNQHWPISESARALEQQAEVLTRTMLNMPHIADLLINLVLIAILPAIAEELFFRGVLQQLFTRAFRFGWIAVLVTAILFSAIHGQMLGFMPRLILGFLLGAIYLLTGNLWLSIIGHFLNNGMQVVAYYLFQHKIMLTDPTKEQSVAWYSALISVAFTIILLRLLEKKSPRRLSPALEDEQ
ncbi:CPBP family intramembrane metalloprotease [Chitinophaga pendula]|uniref:CPBP family intramembrane glutamic endopeptidase n=1 Tax=Chitinophaga TaxID=79328 RepID=UPI000BAEBCCF|nr:MULTISPECIES: CPBP family intramembrane glutamic endopeptidase [Chitinophaga]ASZ10283.1 hypothetical protein CK934_04455 [Chitinophaga sp. MD30]UCJ06755.1 CPBP family intramembrane metalloprotease [Chitinophaga pendula]